MADLVSTKGKWYTGGETRVHVRLESPTEIAVDIFEKGKDGEHVTSDAYPATAAGVREVNEALKGEGVRQTVSLPSRTRLVPYTTVDRKGRTWRGYQRERVSGEVSDLEVFMSGPPRFAGMGDVCTRCGKPQGSWYHSDRAGELISRVDEVRLTIR